MSSQEPVTAPLPAEPPVDPPVDPLFSHAASPFIRTEAPAPVAYASPPSAQTGITPLSTWVAHKTSIQFAFAVLAFLMFVAGSVTVVQANSGMSWRYYVAAAPIVPAALVIWLFVRALSRLDEVQKRMQVQALGFTVAATALLMFGYGFLQGIGWPGINGTFVLPLMALLWGVGMIVIGLRHRLRR